MLNFLFSFLVVSPCAQASSVYEYLVHDAAEVAEPTRMTLLKVLFKGLGQLTEEELKTIVVKETNGKFQISPLSEESPQNLFTFSEPLQGHPLTELDDHDWYLRQSITQGLFLNELLKDVKKNPSWNAEKAAVLSQLIDHAAETELARLKALDFINRSFFYRVLSDESPVHLSAYRLYFRLLVSGLIEGYEANTGRIITSINSSNLNNDFKAITPIFDEERVIAFLTVTAMAILYSGIEPVSLFLHPNMKSFEIAKNAQGLAVILNRIFISKQLSVSAHPKSLFKKFRQYIDFVLQNKPDDAYSDFEISKQLLTLTRDLRATLMATPFAQSIIEPCTVYLSPKVKL